MTGTMTIAGLLAMLFSFNIPSIMAQTTRTSNSVKPAQSSQTTELDNSMYNSMRPTQSSGATISLTTTEQDSNMMFMESIAVLTTPVKSDNDEALRSPQSSQWIDISEPSKTTIIITMDTTITTITIVTSIQTLKPTETSQPNNPTFFTTSTTTSTTTATTTSITTVTTTIISTTTTTASPSTPVCSDPPKPTGFPLGYWLEGSTPGRALDQAFFEQKSSMTPSVCAGLCRSYTFFGLEYGTQCLCGNDIIPGRAFPITSSRCQVPCSGNYSLTCGGLGTLDIYQFPPAPPLIPPGLISNITYHPAGCYAEPSDGSRALNGFVISDASMTPDLCAEVCGMSNFLYFGVENGNECWCDNSLSPKTVDIDQSNCNWPCSGDSSKTCGAKLTFNLYNGTYINTPLARLQEDLVPQLD